MNSPLSYDPVGDVRDALTEECSEVIKEHMKSVRFPPSSATYRTWVGSGNPSPDELWKREVSDVVLAVRACVEEGLLTWDEIVKNNGGKLLRLATRHGPDSVYGRMLRADQEKVRRETVTERVDLGRDGG